MARLLNAIEKQVLRCQCCFAAPTAGFKVLREQPKMLVYCSSCNGKFLPRVKQLILIRDGNRCRRCGAAGGDVALTMHHMVAQAAGGQTSLGNCFSLCIVCHGRWHEEEAERFNRWRRAAEPILFARWIR